MAKRIIVDGKLKCCLCKESLPLNDFHKSKTGIGFYSKCKTCWSNYNKERTRKKNLKSKVEIIDFLNEKWSPVLGYEGIYNISNYGRLKSLDRFDALGSRRYEKLLKPAMCKGYLFYTLNKNCVYKMFKAHRLVAQAFIPNPENKPEVNHKDGNKSNNFVDNLEWCTSKENVKHAIENNLRNTRKGSSHSNSKLTEKDVRNIREMRKYKTLLEISKTYNISFQTVSGICLFKQWKHIT